MKTIEEIEKEIENGIYETRDIINYDNIDVVHVGSYILKSGAVYEHFITSIKTDEVINGRLVVADYNPESGRVDIYMATNIEAYIYLLKELIDIKCLSGLSFPTVEIVKNDIERYYNKLLDEIQSIDLAEFRLNEIIKEYMEVIE